MHCREPDNPIDDGHEYANGTEQQEGQEDGGRHESERPQQRQIGLYLHRCAAGERRFHRGRQSSDGEDQRSNPCAFRDNEGGSESAQVSMRSRRPENIAQGGCAIRKSKRQPQPQEDRRALHVESHMEDTAVSKQQVSHTKGDKPDKGKLQ